MSESEEIAKAVQESVKLGVKGLETAEKAGSFLAKVFQQPACEILGMITDKLRFVRWKRSLQMMDEVAQILDERGIQNPRPVSPKIALPIIEEASLEDDPTLQDLWNHLLANAMDPQFNDDIRYGFIDMIKNITPTDVIILNCMYNLITNIREISLAKIFQHDIEKRNIIAKCIITDDEYAISTCNLVRMQLVSPHLIDSNGEQDRTDLIALTPLGKKFVEACMR